MSADNELFDCHSLTTERLMGVLQCVRPTQRFWFRKLFRDAIAFDTEIISFPRVYQNEYHQLIPFVCPCDQAPVMDTNTDPMEMMAFKPPYVKAKAIVNVCEPFQKTVGEFCETQFTEEQRYRMKVAEVTRMLEEALQQREEQMMADALVHGKYIVEGELYPKTLIDFKRCDEHENLCFDWNKESCTIYDDLQDVIDMIFCKSGAQLDTIVLGTEACKALKKNKQFIELLKCEREIGRTLIDQNLDISMTPDCTGPIRGWRFEGNIGCLNIWCSNQTYDACDEMGCKVKVPYIPPDAIIGFASGSADCGIGATRLYGAIRDISSLRATDRFMKSWIQEDPSSLCIMIQSAPMPVIINANASFSGVVKSK